MTWSFRDARLSNLIGFDYQNSTAEEAAADLVDRLRAIARRQEADAPLLAVIALDGENCWDFYEANGNQFLHALYRRLSHEVELVTTTVSDFLSTFPARSSLKTVGPGSWINGTLDTWVGDPEHNAAWDLLAASRRLLSEAVPAEAQAETARREVLIAEGSDWFWWFGRSHDSGMDVIWDNLFRLHLRNIYTALGRNPPTALFDPIVRQGQGSAWKRPDRKITPRLNGHTDDAEWDAGGYVDITALFGAMHPPQGQVRRIWFGHDDANLYLRFDLLEDADLNLRILFAATSESDADGFQPSRVLQVRRSGSRVTLEVAPQRVGSAGSPAWTGQSASPAGLAFAVPLGVLLQDPGHRLQMIAQVFDEHGKTVEHVPPSGSITVRPSIEPTAVVRRPLKILFVSAEVAPFAKVGGLADVAGALPKALRALGHDVRVVMPRYGTIDVDKYGLRKVLAGVPVPLAHQPVPADILQGRLGDDIPVYLIENQQFFGREGMYGFWDDDARFLYFSRAALEMLRPLDFKPDVIHVNDWHSAVIPNMLARLYLDDPFYAGIATALTIHNLAFQGTYGYGTLHLAWLDQWGVDQGGSARPGRHRESPRARGVFQ